MPYRKHMDKKFEMHYIDDALVCFKNYKKLAERAIDQVNEKEFFQSLDEEGNSIAVIVKHMTGNMFSRWTDFLTTDGEKPDRHRDMEFVITDETTQADMMDRWEKGWHCVFDAIEPLKTEDFDRIVQIRGEDHSIVQAINRQLTHYSSHIGQIIFLAKHLRSTSWKTLSIPRNKSAEFNAHLQSKGEGA